MPIKFVAFDIDGVIFSSENFLQESYYNGVIEFLKKNPSKKFHPPEKEKILKFVGKTYKEILTGLFPGINNEEITEMRKYILKSLIYNIFSRKGVLLEGAKEILRYLKEKKIKTGTASNGSKIYVEAVLQTYNLYEYFNEIIFVGVDNFEEKTDILKYYKKKYMLKKNEILMVGDRITDLNAAISASTLFAGIKGHGFEDELKGSDYIIDNLNQLINIIDSSIK